MLHASIHPEKGTCANETQVPFFDDKRKRGTFPANNATRRVPTSIHYSLMIELLSFR